MALTGEKFDGDNLELDWGGATVEQEVLREVVISTKRETYDKTGAGQKARRKHGGKREYSLRITLWASTKDADVRGLFDETDPDPAAFVVYPNGNASGEAKRSGSALVDSVEESVPHDGMVAITVNCTVDGDVTRATVT